MIGPEQVGVIAAALIAAAVAFYTNRVTKAANAKTLALQKQQLALEQRAVDRQAYDRAREIDLETINGLRRDLTAERVVTDDVRRELADAHRENARLRDQIEDCNEQIRILRRRLAQAGVLDDRHSEPPQAPPERDR